MEASDIEPDIVRQAQPAAGWARWEPWLFIGLVLAQLVPVWSVAHLPTQDGASHVANADIIRRYYLPGGEPLREYYRLIVRPVPNLLGHLIMAGLLFVVRPVLAEKMLVSLCLVLLPLAARYALGAIRPGSRFLAYLVFPFGYNWLFQLGFYNFSLGLGLFFLLIGYWLKHRHEMTWRRAFMLGGLALVLHLSHLGAAAPALGILVTLIVVFALADRTGASKRSAAMSLVALAPAVLLAGYYSWQMAVGHTGGVMSSPRSLMALYFVELDVLVSHDYYERGPAVTTAAFFAMLSGFVLLRKLRQRRCDRWDILLAIIGLFIILFFRGGRKELARLFVSERMNILAFMVLLLWLGAREYGAVLARGVALIAAAMAVMVVGINTASYLRIAPYLAEYTSVAGRIEADKTFLVVVFQPKGADDSGDLSLKTWPFLHASGYIAAERRAIDLSDYEAYTEHFAVRWRDGLDTLRIMPQLEPQESLRGDMLPPVVQLAHYEVVTGRKIDYVMLWWDSAGDHKKRGVPTLLAELEACYELIETSKPRGLMKVYRRK